VYLPIIPYVQLTETPQILGPIPRRELPGAVEPPIYCDRLYAACHWYREPVDSRPAAPGPDARAFAANLEDDVGSVCVGAQIRER
jgi:hypothetical protein